MATKKKSTKMKKPRAAKPKGPRLIVLPVRFYESDLNALAEAARAAETNEGNYVRETVLARVAKAGWLVGETKYTRTKPHGA